MRLTVIHANLCTVLVL